ncbi:MAG TPA: heme-dependent oxidative N-demethylase subunit alpha family protein [Tepidisphaeraceae bacterium]|nr:heme-dependent oxidative N-demethylase subunit alpha family protein [Tepidisphaeraceae bacterium]
MFPLPDPPLYLPLDGGTYRVAAGLRKFGADCGGGEFDRLVFQFDRTAPAYLAAKRAVAGAARKPVWLSLNLPPATAAAMAGFVAGRLAGEHPALFSLDGRDLACRVTGETVDALDLAAVGLQVQEDFAVVQTDADQQWLAATHVSFPSGWAPEDKLGLGFAAVHAPVAGIGPVNRRADELVRVMVNATAGLVRFAWGVTFDDALDHHPRRHDPRRRPFNPASPRAFVRVERQTMWGLPHVGAAVFTIRTYVYDAADVARDPARRGELARAIESMPPASLEYKGLAASRDALLAWLHAQPT